MLKTGKTENVGIDRLRWLVAAALIAGGVGGNWYFQTESLLIRVVALIAILGSAVLVLWNSKKGKEIVALLKDSRSEVRRVVWPTTQETNQTTLMVLLIVLI